MGDGGLSAAGASARLHFRGSAGRARTLYFIAAAVLAALVPLILFAGLWVRALLNQSERDVQTYLALARRPFRHGSTRRSRRSSRSCGRRLLQSLDEPDLATFQTTASRMVSAIPQWSMLALIDPASGRQLAEYPRFTAGDLDRCRRGRKAGGRAAPAQGRHAVRRIAGRGFRQLGPPLPSGHTRRHGSVRARGGHEARYGAATAHDGAGAQPSDRGPGRAGPDSGAVPRARPVPRPDRQRAVAGGNQRSSVGPVNGQTIDGQHVVTVFQPLPGDRMAGGRRHRSPAGADRERTLELGADRDRCLEPHARGRAGGVPVLQRDGAKGQRRAPGGVPGIGRTRRPAALDNPGGSVRAAQGRIGTGGAPARNLPPCEEQPADHPEPAASSAPAI